MWININNWMNICYRISGLVPISNDWFSANQQWIGGEHPGIPWDHGVPWRSWLRLRSSKLRPTCWPPWCALSADVYLSIYLSIYLSVYLSIYLSIYAHTHTYLEHIPPSVPSPSLRHSSPPTIGTSSGTWLGSQGAGHCQMGTWDLEDWRLLTLWSLGNSHETNSKPREKRWENMSNHEQCGKSWIMDVIIHGIIMGKSWKNCWTSPSKMEVWVTQKSNVEYGGCSKSGNTPSFKNMCFS
jgi:hypothetical protein